MSLIKCVCFLLLFGVWLALKQTINQPVEQTNQSMANKDEIWSVVGFGFAIIISLYVAVGVRERMSKKTDAQACISLFLS